MQNQKMKDPVEVREVFVPGGFPKYTYQTREKHRVEAKLQEALDRVHKFIAVAGPTKSGKTVLVRKLVPEDKSVWLEGGHIQSAKDVWDAVFAELEMPTTVTETRGSQKEDTATFELDAGFRPGGIGAGTKHQDMSKSSANSGRSETHVAGGAKAAINALLARKSVLVIDDFHYISPQVQSDLIRALKPAVFKGLRVVLLLIPHRMHQAAQAEMDVDGRTHTVPIPEWQPEELFSIAETGYRTLRVECSAKTIDQLVKESFASPHLMQDFCSSLCFRNGVTQQYMGNAPLPIIKLPELPTSFFQEISESLSPEAFKALRRGPERTNRKDRALNGGGTCDTYEAVLLALHEMGGTTPVDWPALRRELQSLLKEVPQQHEVTRALEKMDEIAKKRAGEPVIDYNRGELHLVDPFFRYYLKWNASILEDGSAEHPMPNA